MAPRLLRGGLVPVQHWGLNNPTLPLPSAEVKIVPKPTGRTLKLSLPSA